MLPRAAAKAARLAAVLPTSIASIAKYTLGSSLPMQEKLSEHHIHLADSTLDEVIPRVRSAVIVVVDGLGHEQLRLRSGHARTLSGFANRRIETVAPSTTGSALPTITTGSLPGTHGLVGYKIRHPRLGLLRTLNDWNGITDADNWQRSVPLFHSASYVGARASVIGRNAHEHSGLTSAILSGADYVNANTIEDRFTSAREILASAEPQLVYLYVDELDKAGHHFGWQSHEWTASLERLDAAVNALLSDLADDVGVVVTADHGMIDVTSQDEVIIDDVSGIGLSGVVAIGGEPRFRNIYVDEADRLNEVAGYMLQTFSEVAHVVIRDQVNAAGMFGRIDTEVADRLGSIMLIAKKRHALVLESERADGQHMVGQHGSLTDEELGIPLLLAGAFAETGFFAALNRIALAVDAQ